MCLYVSNPIHFARKMSRNAPIKLDLIFGYLMWKIFAMELGKLSLRKCTMLQRLNEKTTGLCTYIVENNVARLSE